MERDHNTRRECQKLFGYLDFVIDSESDLPFLDQVQKC